MIQKGLPGNRSSGNSTFVLFPVCLALFLGSCAHTAPYKDKPSNYGVVEGQTSMNGIAKAFHQIYSYSSVNGKIKSSPEDYVIIAHQSVFHFFAHKDHVDETRTWLKEACCESGQSHEQSILKALSWGRSLFDGNFEVQVEIVLVPENYSYHYATRNWISGRKTTVRLAQKFTSNFPKNKSIYYKQFVRTIVHELTHTYFALSKNPAANKLSSETTAHLVGTCAETLLGRDYEWPMAHWKLEGTSLETIRKKTTQDYQDAIRRLRKNPDTVIGRIIAELIVEKIHAKYGTSPVREAEVLRTFCRRAVATRHDFTKSLGMKMLEDVPVASTKAQTRQAGAFGD